MADQVRKIIYLSPSGPTLKETGEIYTPKDSQSLIRVEYSGINPADIKHAFIGIHSSVAGYDLAGEVISVGPKSPFKIGDKVFGENAVGLNRPFHYGAHQGFAIAEPALFYLVPTLRMSMHEAAALPTVTLTAADGLFNVLDLAFPSAGLQGTEAQSILIWGAASAVGVAAVQLAKAAGHGPIFVTASAKHHPTLEALGADFCFDYKDRDVVAMVRETIGRSGTRLTHVFDTVGAGVVTQGDEFEKSSAALATRCVLKSGSGGDEEEEEVKFVCVLPVALDKRWSMCLAMRNGDFPLVPPGPKEWSDRANKVMAWVTDNYGEGKYKLPNVRIVRGAERGMEAMRWSADGRSSLEKIVIEHPL